ncbi:DUF5682 family protein, partial [Nonomuraea sp. NPDC004354]
MTVSATVSVLGIRHHGPGSARAVREELRRLEPDAILIEGPPEADALVSLAPEMEPPVALLAHAGDRAVFWPFAVFSPEWQAILYGTAAGIPVRFIDLPAAHTLAAPGTDAHTDPLGELAAAAGYDDPERWWEDAVEHRGDTPFQAIAEAMTAVREGHRPGEREARREAHMRRSLRAAIKEGFERVAVVCGAWHVPALTGRLPSATADNALLRGLPKVKAELTWVPWTYGRLASWSGYGAGITSPGWYHHLFTVPDRPVERWLTAAADVLREEGRTVSSAHVIEAVRLAEGLAALRGRPLAGLGEVTDAVRAVLCDGDELLVELVQRRMVVSDRLGTVSERTPMVPLQRDLREQRRKVRLNAEPGERELDLDLRRPLDLARSHLLHRLRLLGVEWGRPAETRGKGTFREVWRLAWRPEFDLTLIEAAALGTSVESAATRHARDLAAEAGDGGRDGAGLDGSATVTIPPHAAGPASPGGVSPGGSASPGGRVSPAGPASPGGRVSPAGPASPGGRVSPGGRAGLTRQADPAGLAGLTLLVERCLLADLWEALPDVLAALSAKAALDADLTHLMAALPAMARAHRYGDVRGTSAAGLAAVAESMLDRICAGLPAAVTGLSDESAAALVTHIDAVHTAATLLTPAPSPASAPSPTSFAPASGPSMTPPPSATPGFSTVPGFSKAPDPSRPPDPTLAPSTTPARPTAAAPAPETAVPAGPADEQPRGTRPAPHRALDDRLTPPEPTAALPGGAPPAPRGAFDDRPTPVEPAAALPGREQPVSDRPASASPSSGSPVPERSAREHLGSDRPSPDRLSSDRSAGEHFRSDRLSSDRPSPDRSAGEHFGSDRPSPDRLSSDRSAGEHFRSDRLSSDRPS